MKIICSKKHNTNLESICLDPFSFWPVQPSFAILSSHSSDSLDHYLQVICCSKIWKFLQCGYLLTTQPQTYYMLVPGLNRRPLLYSPFNHSLKKKQSLKSAHTMYSFEHPLPIELPPIWTKMRKCSANW